MARARLLGFLTSEHLGGKPLLLNIFLPIDTPVCAINARIFNARAAGSTGLRADRPHRLSPGEVGVEEFAVRLDGGLGGVDTQRQLLWDVRAARDLIRICVARSGSPAASPSFVGQGVHHAEGRDAGIRNLTLQRLCVPP